MEPYFIRFFQYNYWANSRYREIISTLNLKILEKETEYGILLDRIIHIFASYEMWYQRMIGKSPKTMLNSKNFDSMDQLIAKWTELDELLIKYVRYLEESNYDEIVSYESLDGKPYSRKIKDILFHLIQHPTYHRGQISSIFKHTDLPDLPATDVVVFLNE